MTEPRYIYPVDPEGLQCMPNMRTERGPQMNYLAHQFRLRKDSYLICGRCLVQVDTSGRIVNNPQMVAAAPELLMALKSAHERLIDHDLCTCVYDGGSSPKYLCQAATSIQNAEHIHDVEVRVR